MAKMVLGSAVLAMALGVAACGKPASEPAASESAAATTADARPAAFAQCAACHAVAPGKHGVGPSLAGVYAAKAGAATDYAYSDAMQASGITWDEANLDTWLINPAKLIPGTKMVYAGMGDPADRKALIDYLKTLK